jgi:hypothetical protein
MHTARVLALSCGQPGLGCLCISPFLHSAEASTVLDPILPPTPQAVGVWDYLDVIVISRKCGVRGRMGEADCAI